MGQLPAWVLWAAGVFLVSLVTVAVYGLSDDAEARRERREHEAEYPSTWMRP